MSPISDNTVRSTEAFLREIATVAWLRQAGIPSSHACAVASVSEALDSDKRLWKRSTRALEKEALTRIGDSSIGWIFDATSKAIQQPLYDGAVAYFARRKACDPSYDDCGVDAGLLGEMMDCVKRDIAWAAVEAALPRPGLFSALLPRYREGRWPCSWVPMKRASSPQEVSTATNEAIIRYADEYLNRFDCEVKRQK